jgi:hypothetical protein
MKQFKLLEETKYLGRYIHLGFDYNRREGLTTFYVPQDKLKTFAQQYQRVHKKMGLTFDIDGRVGYSHLGIVSPKLLNKWDNSQREKELSQLILEQRIDDSNIEDEKVSLIQGNLIWNQDDYLREGVNSQARRGIKK